MDTIRLEEGQCWKYDGGLFWIRGKPSESDAEGQEGDFVIIDEIWNERKIIGSIVLRERLVHYISKVKAKLVPNANLIWKELNEG